MKKRELILLLATILIIGVGLYLSFAPEDTTGGAGSLATGDLDAVRAKFEENMKVLRNGRPINERFNRLAVSLEDKRAPGVDPGMAAQGQIFQVLTEKLGVPNPRISTYKREDIKNVEEYYFVNITFNVEGGEMEMKRLLRDMEALGFLIKSFKMVQPNHNQFNNLSMEVVVSRLVKNDAPKKAAKWKPSR